MVHEACKDKELKVSLSGNLGFVSLDEVLRLLTRSSQQGAVDISGDEIRGRIYVTKGGVALATTSDDARMHSHLAKSGLVDEEFLQSVEAGSATLDPIVEKTGGALTELLREMTVESLYQLGLNGDAFDVVEGEWTNYASPDVFELESILEDAKQRLSDWAEVARTVTDLSSMIYFNRDLGDRQEINIDRDAWRVLSEIGSGASVSAIASALGTTDFWAARIAARLINEDLVVLDAVVVDEPAPEEDPVETPSETNMTGSVTEADGDSDQAWWEDATTEQSEEAAIDAAEEPEAAEEEHTSIFGAYKPQDSVEQEPEAADAGAPAPDATDDGEVEDEVEDDTEAFLEKVFSELETSDDDSEEEGYGLLRRRRLGAMRDTSTDS